MPPVCSSRRLSAPRQLASAVLNKQRAKCGEVGFGSTRLHDLRGIHTTALLDAGIPVHTVAQRIGDDPAVVLRNYAKRKRTKTADANLAHAIGKLAAGFLDRA
jgi:integrase